ncbi:hypothetical protein SCLCIDRAFT_23270, partial [Scleroderma citrinum Foug A]
LPPGSSDRSRSSIILGNSRRAQGTSINSQELGAGTGGRDDGEGNGHSDGRKDPSFGSPSEDPSQRGGGIWHAYRHKDKAPSPIQQSGDAPEVTAELITGLKRQRSDENDLQLQTPRCKFGEGRTNVRENYVPVPPQVKRPQLLEPFEPKIDSKSCRVEGLEDAIKGVQELLGKQTEVLAEILQIMKGDSKTRPHKVYFL